MNRFVMECPKCHRYIEAATGFFTKKKIVCTCGNNINVQTERISSRKCPSCGNTVVYDQAKGKTAKCPVCQAHLITEDSLRMFFTFRCKTCNCELQASKAAKEERCPVCNSINDVQAALKLMQSKQKTIPSVIEYEGDNHTFVWKHPITDFILGSQLLVHESQEAVFFRNGEALDSFSAGRHTLETSALPKLNTLYHLPVDGNPFHAEVYFVNLTTQMGIKWGTNSKVRLFDPISGIPIEIGASGSFNLQVCDPRRVVIRLVGTTSTLQQEQLFNGDAGYFRSLIMTQVKAQIAKIIKANHINVLEIDEHIDIISLHLKEAINPILAEYGFVMPDFYVSNIVMPDDDPNYRRHKQQHADQYLRVREEEIRKAEVEAAYERKTLEAQTEARLKIISAQSAAEAARIEGQAKAEIYRMQADAEAYEMQAKGYTYQQETARQVGVEAMHNDGGASGIVGLTGELMQMGVGLGAVGSVIGMTKEAIAPIADATSNFMHHDNANGWNCNCGTLNILSKFCPNCGKKKAETVICWTCAECGKENITSNFCPDCGAKKVIVEHGWTCSQCGKQRITSRFCPECGAEGSGGI